MSTTTFTVIGLVLFVSVFAVIVVRAYWPGSAAAHERHSQLPLDGDRS